MGQEPKPTDLIYRLRTNIYEPTVATFFDEFEKYGCVDACEELYGHVSDEEVVSIIQNVQASQVNKEKALWPIYLARGQLMDVEKSVQIGVSVDVLWSLSIIMDDIEDNDITRFGTETVWAKLGKERAVEIAHAGLDGVISYLNTTNGERTGQLAYMYVMEGMRSLELHKYLGLGAGIRSIIRNYWMRDDFHSAFPFHALFGNNTSPEAKSVIRGVRMFNQAGQILNDLSDLRLQQDQTYRLSDLTGRRISFALKLLYESANEVERLVIEKCFGAENILNNDAQIIMEMANKPEFIEEIGQYVKRLYKLSHSIISRYFLYEDSEKMLAWIEYKLRKLN